MSKIEKFTKIARDVTISFHRWSSKTLRQNSKWIQTSPHQFLFVSSLMHSTSLIFYIKKGQTLPHQKMADLLKTKYIHEKEIHATPHPIRQVESNTEITIKEGSSNKVATVYLDLDEKVRKLHPYEPLHLTEYEPEQRYMRRHWIDGIRLSASVAVMKRSYGSSIGNVNIVWKVSEDDPNYETKMAKAVLVVTEDLPQNHTRKMRKDFLSKYLRLVKTSKYLRLVKTSKYPRLVKTSKYLRLVKTTKYLRLVKTSKAHLNDIYRELTGDHTAASSEQERLLCERIAHFVASNDEDNIITDPRKLNGKTGTSFTEFWDEVNKLFTEYEGFVQERMHGSFLYLPFVISIRELSDSVMKRMPGILVLSAEWVRLQFAPRNTHLRSALFHTGRFDMKFQVQRRQMRSQHEDAEYVYHHQLYAKEFAIRFKDYCSFISSDDKALIPVGEGILSRREFVLIMLH